MTVTDRTDATDAEFEARLGRIEAAPTAEEDTERRVLNAIKDPGSVTPRIQYRRGEYETIPAWGARAVLIVLKSRGGDVR